MRARALWLCALVAGCSSWEVAPRVRQAPAWDDDRPRLLHCDFTPAPLVKAAPAPAIAPLRAGYAARYISMPIGVPLGAYGGRVHALGMASPPDARAARWAFGMTPSVGVHEAARAEALALDAGDGPLLIVRVDAPLVTENVLFELERAIAADGSLRGRILLTASHSHASWGAWLPTVHLAPGTDRPRRELFERVIEASRDASLAAIDALEPARIGVALSADYDPDDRLNRDRREDNDTVLGPDGNDAGRDKDPFAWALRVDRLDGEPMVALANVPIHGTVGDEANPLASRDATGAVARGLGAALGYPVMHLQGAAGDVSPAANSGRAHCPDATRCLDMPRLEVLGARAAELLAPLVRDIETHDSAALELVTRTFAVGRGSVVERPDGQQLYYLPPDRDVYPDGVLFDGARAASPFDEFNTIGGAGLCGDPMGITFAPIVGSSHLGPYHSCIDLDTGAGTILSIFDIPVPTLPICDSVRATAAALRIAGLPGGDWLVLGIPGEPTAPFAHYLRERSPAGAERTLLIGYTDDYSGYMLTAEDWLSGGYECSTNIWGPREGEQVLDGVLAAAAIAWSPEREDPEAGTDRFDAFAFPPSDEVAATITSDHGSALGGSLSEATLFWPDTSDEVVSFTPTVERAVGVARFAFSGGDPAVDDPEVVVERQVAGRWLPLADRASSREGAVVLTYTPFPLESTTPSAHRYAATWQPLPGAPLSLADPLGPFGLELGSYRLCAQGRARAAAGVTGYAICSPPIEVVAATLGAQSTATLRGALLTVSATLTPAPGLRALRDSDAGPSDGSIPLAAPWTVVATRSDASTTMVNIDPIDGTASADLGPGAAVVSVEIRDPHGNGGVLTP